MKVPFEITHLNDLSRLDILDAWAMHVYGQELLAEREKVTTGINENLADIEENMGKFMKSMQETKNTVKGLLEGMDDVIDKKLAR